MSKLLKTFLKNKKILFSVAGFGLLLFSLSLNFVEAAPHVPVPDICQPPGTYDLCDGCGWLPHEWPRCLICFISYLASLPIRIAFAQMVMIFGIGSLLAGLLYAIVSVIVTWLLSTILSIGIVPGANNTPDIVTMGWNFTRQFANLFFILALVFIGLATILRIKEYEAKKALPTLIIIALLINFTPVIVGFVVDMGNIVTNFFIFHAGGIHNFWAILQAAGEYLICSIFHIFARDGWFFRDFLIIIGEFLGIVIYGVALFIFFHLAILVYILVGAVFFFRTVFLWILMILSPIAFLSKVFPAGRTTKMVFPDILHWDKWWEKLIQWTIIGIPIGFFLYLSNLIMVQEGRIQDIFNTSGPGGLEEGIGVFEAEASSTFLVVLHSQFTSLFTSLLAPVLGLVVLIMGMMISFKAAPEGAKGIMRFTTEKGVRKGWSGIRAGYASMGRTLQRYDAAKLRMGRGEALKHTVTHTFSDTGRQMWNAWKHKDPPSSGDGGGAGGADGGGASPSTPPTGSSAPIDHSDEIHEANTTLGTEQFATPVTPAPPTRKHRERIKKAARFWYSPENWPKHARFGGRVAASILGSAEKIAREKIDKEMGIDEESKKNKGKKGAKNCLFCMKEIPNDSVVCPYCREPVA